MFDPELCRLLQRHPRTLRLHCMINSRAQAEFVAGIDLTGYTGVIARAQPAAFCGR
ncbi:MAG: hypothetical protein KDA85_21885 [Planctomycetaceae bacterium]|nr:hypothetical protein [Planctomycetaceae bacterium]